MKTATKLVPSGNLWRAKAYPRKYLEKRGALSCHL